MLESCNNIQPVKLMNIKTGVVAPDNVNVYKPKEVGEAIITKITGQRPTDVKFKKVDYAIQIPSKARKKMAVDSTAKDVDSDFLFSEISKYAKQSSELKEAFGYELSTYPLSLYKEKRFMRPADGRSAFENHLLKKYGVTIEDADFHLEPEADVLVMDGGMLLHFVTYAWVKGSSFGKITGH